MTFRDLDAEALAFDEEELRATFDEVPEAVEVDGAAVRVAKEMALPNETRWGTVVLALHSRTVASVRFFSATALVKRVGDLWRGVSNASEDAGLVVPMVFLDDEA